MPRKDQEWLERTKNAQKGSRMARKEGPRTATERTEEWPERTAND